MIKPVLINQTTSITKNDTDILETSPFLNVYIRESFALIRESFALIRESYAFIRESFVLIRKKYFFPNENELNGISYDTFLISYKNVHCVF